MPSTFYLNLANERVQLQMFSGLLLRPLDICIHVQTPLGIEPIPRTPWCALRSNPNVLRSQANDHILQLHLTLENGQIPMFFGESFSFPPCLMTSSANLLFG